MSGGVWMASYVVLWAAVAVLLVVVLALVRQIGVLHVRLDEAVSGAGAGVGAGVGAGGGGEADEPSSPEGPPLGGAAPMPGRIGYQRSPLTLVAFTSATCELSQVLAPALNVVDKQYSDVRVLELPLGPRTIAAFEAFNVLHTPFVVAVGQDGRVRGRGRARNLQQLEAFVARALALATRAAGGAGSPPRKPDAPDGGGGVAEAAADEPEAKAAGEVEAGADAVPEAEAETEAPTGSSAKPTARSKATAPPVAEAEAEAPPAAEQPAAEQPADNIVLLDVAADPARASV